MKKMLFFMGILLIVVSMISGCSLTGKHYHNGTKSFQNGNYEEAASYYATAIQENPNRSDYYIGYGMSLIKLSKYEEALIQFDKASMDKDIMLIRQNNKRVLRGKGITYYYMQEYQKAIDNFGLALNISELDDLNSDILYYLSNSLMTIGSYQEALDTYNTLLLMDKNDAIVYANRALCYQYMGDYEKCLEDYNSAIALQPEEYDFYLGKYYALVENSDEVSAQEVLTQASTIKVETSEDKYNQAKIHYYQEDYEKALSEFSECFTAGFTEAYYYIGEIYRIKKDYANAIYYYETFISEGKFFNPNVYNQIAVCLMKSGDNKGAIDYLEKGNAYQHAGTMQVLKENVIIAYEGLGMYNKAMEKMEEYLSEYPEEKALREMEFIATRLADVAIIEEN